MEATESADRGATARRGQRYLNVNKPERQLSLAVGTVLIGCGLTRASKLQSLILTGLGAALAYRGATGHCHVYGAFGISTRPLAEEGESAGDRGPSASELESPKNLVDKERFEKLKTAQVDRGRDEERAIEIAAEEVKELRRREGRSKNKEGVYPDEDAKVWERNK